MSVIDDPGETTGHSPPPQPGGVKKHAYLVVLSGPNFGELHKLEPGHELTLGRQAGVDIRMTEDVISRRHLTITALGNGAHLKDLGSQNGTYVEGERVESATLQDGHRIQVGFGTTLKFTVADELEAEYQRKLADGAMREPLTELYNRRHFEERLTAEFAAAKRHGRALSVMMLDIDHFKSVNDKLGHLAGDAVLRMVAKVLKQAVRKEDVLARYGGEEFVVLAREPDFAGARILAERMRRLVENAQCSWQETDVKVTISVGLTLAELSEKSQLSCEQDLIAAADRALYMAKQRGRNCVADSPAVPEPWPTPSSS
jgi:two-component system, cell cycle response regulator